MKKAESRNVYQTDPLILSPQFGAFSNEEQSPCLLVFWIAPSCHLSLRLRRRAEAKGGEADADSRRADTERLSSHARFRFGERQSSALSRRDRRGGKGRLSRGEERAGGRGS